MSAMASQITGVSIVYWTVCTGAVQRKHQSFASLAFVRGIHRWPVNSPHKGPVTRKMFPLEDVIIQIKICAEYRDMLPRPRLVCQEPGLRWIGRSRGVPDKSRRGLGNMSRYSARMLICFIAYIFLLLFLCGFGWELCRTVSMCTVPSAIVHCNQNEAGHQTIKVPSMSCWCAAGPSKHYLVSMPQTGEIDR